LTSDSLSVCSARRRCSPELASYSPSSTARRMFSIFRSMAAIRSPASGLKSVDASQICRHSLLTARVNICGSAHKSRTPTDREGLRIPPEPGHYTPIGLASAHVIEPAIRVEADHVRTATTTAE